MELDALSNITTNTMEKDNLIYRSVDLSASQEENSREISGVAIVFDSWSRDLGGFQEIIHREAVDQELINNSDIVMNVNHDDDKMVARSRNGEGTLKLDLQDDGLHFRFDAPTTQLGDELLYNVRNGNLFECSFAFSIDYKDDKAERWYHEGDLMKREINKINGLYDCSIVTHAAYPATSCSARFKQVQAQSDEVNKAMDAIDAEIEKL